MNVFRRLALSAVVSAAVGVPVAGQAQSCPTPPGKDVLLFVDNSSSITNAEFDEAQQAIAGIAASVLSRPGYRLAVVNWGCEGGRRTTRDGCRVDLATGSAIPGGWSSNPADFAYAGNNSAANRVCRSFGTNFAGSVNRNNCGGANFSVNINDDYAQHGLKILEGVLYGGGTTGGNDSYNQPTLGPSAPTQQLMLIHMTDADPNSFRFDGSSIREMPSTETGLGFYHYSNRFKNVRNAVIVGVGIDAAAANAVNRGEVAAFASRGGTATDYDAAHPTALSTQAFDTGTPRIATYSATYNDATILSAANTAFNATVPACVILRKQSVGGTGSFSFSGGTNGLPSALTLSTATTNPQAASGVFLSQFNTPTSITETVPSNWSLTSVGCVNASNANVPVTSNLATGQLTIPAAQVVAGAQLTCTFTNTSIQPDFGTCDARMFLDTNNRTPNPDVSTLWEIEYATSPFTANELGSGLARNGLGYNPVDNYIYGIEFDGLIGNELIRVGSDGSSVILGAVAGLPNTYGYSSGTFSPSGDYYVFPGLDIYNTLYRINVVTRSATPITTSSSHYFADLAWYGGALYGIDSKSRLIRIDPLTGATTDVGSTAPLVSSVAVWGMQNGLFATDNQTDAIYSVDPATGAATLLSSTVGIENGDGANCPTASIRFNSDLSVTKTNTPSDGPSDLPGDTYTPGEARTYHVVVTNTGAFGAQNITVSDPVPAGVSASTVSWTCASTSGDAACGAASGTGALNDTGLDLPPGAVATYLVTMTVPAGFTGNLTNTVTITPPSTINDTNPANNTATDTDVRGGRITIVKDAVPNSAQDFAFTTTGTGLSNFSLDDDTDGTLSNTRTFTGLVAGSYSVTEAALAGWNLTGLTCVDPDGGSTVNLSTRVATIDLDPGEDITCTYTNSQQGSIVIVKDAVPNHAQDFAFTTTGTGLSAFSLDDDADGTLINTRTFTGLAPGSYSVTETALAGWNLTGLTCVDPDSGSTVNLGTRAATIDLDAGETVTCTYTNTQQGSIVIVKDAVPNHAQDFAFTTTGTGLSNFSLDDDADGTLSNTRTFTGLAPGSYSVTETALAGWNLTGLTCADPDSGSTVNLGTRAATIDLDAGETVTCTYTNTLRQTDLQVVKTASPNPVVSSDVVTYQIVVTNNGPLAADGAVLTDVAGVGQDCTTPSTTATCSATGGATCPSTTVPVSSLLGSGITIPTLPVGGQVTLGLQCTVSATGTP